MRGIGHEFDRGTGSKNAGSDTAIPRPSGDEQKSILVEVHEPQPSSVQLAQRIISPIVAPLSTTAIAFIVAIFILLQREDLRDRLIRLFGLSDLHRTTVAMNDAARRLSNYFLTQLAINAMFGVIIGTGLFVIGVPSPAALGCTRHATALRALHRRPTISPVAAHACRRCRSRLVDGCVDGGAICRCRGDRGPSGRTGAVWPQHGPLALLGGRGGDILDMAVGAGRADLVHTADALPRGAWVARRIATPFPSSAPMVAREPAACGKTAAPSPCF